MGGVLGVEEKPRTHREFHALLGDRDFWVWSYLPDPDASKEGAVPGTKYGVLRPQKPKPAQRLGFDEYVTETCMSA